MRVSNQPAQPTALKQSENKVEPKPAAGSEKVPEHALLVYDDEKYAKELMDLKLMLKNVYRQNVELESHVRQVESKKRDKESEFDRITMEKKIVLNNRSGKLETLNNAQSAAAGKITMAQRMMQQIPEYEKSVKEKERPLESLVKKFERNGYTVEQAFNLFDDNGDGLLTAKEVRAGFRDQEILQVLDSEIDALVKAIDKDANGMVSLQEWVATLQPKLDVEKDFRQIMCNVNIDDPIDLEEKALDLKFRTSRLESELMVLRKANGDIGNRVRGNIGKNLQHVKMTDKIKSLEDKLTAKQEEAKLEKLALEDKIKQGLMAKDQVYQDFYEIQRLKEREENEHSMKLEQAQSHLNTLDYKVAEVTQLITMLTNEKIDYDQNISRMKVKLVTMSQQEQALDKEIEQILGRAIDGKDLRLLYELDLMMLN